MAAGIQSVGDYLAAQPQPARRVLTRVRAVIRKALPRATEGISYAIPVFKMNGRMVLYFAGFKGHYSIYPATASLLRELGDDVGDHLHSKATLRFSYEEAVPVRLITRIARLRTAEVGGASASRRSAKQR